MTPKTQKQWMVQGTGSFDCLRFNEDAPVPELGDKDVLVRFYGAPLNSRDMQIPLGEYPRPYRDGVVPGSDGAGVVEAVGSKVSRFKSGDKVVTQFYQAHLHGSLDKVSHSTGLGGKIDGSFQQYGVYDEQGLVRLPSNLSYLEGATLTCAGLTAWNALYGLPGRQLTPGDWVLTQGTGGVSIFALQFAKAAGAKVIATTSSKDKSDRLKALGADHVIDYKEDANWGQTAKKLTGDVGVQHVLEVGGPGTMANSLEAIAVDGVISIIGYLSSLGGKKAESQPTFLDAYEHICLVRGVVVGSRQQFEEMNRAIEANSIKPVLDQKVFKLEEVKDAYQYLYDQKHFGKVCISIE